MSCMGHGNSFNDCIFFLIFIVGGLRFYQGFESCDKTTLEPLDTGGWIISFNIDRPNNIHKKISAL